MIIGFSGKKQSGKSTAAAWLVDKGFIRLSYADTMKRIARQILMGCGLSEDKLSYYMHHKELTMPLVGCSMRHFLQTLGTDWGRNLIHPDLWVMAAAVQLNAISSHDHQFNIVFDDVRFENEADNIRARGGRIIHLIRDAQDADSHASENGIEIKDEDLVIFNASNLEALRMAVFVAAGVAL
jgi:hypothetical protein